MKSDKKSMNLQCESQWKFYIRHTFCQHKYIILHFKLCENIQDGYKYTRFYFWRIFYNVGIKIFCYKCFHRLSNHLKLVGYHFKAAHRKHLTWGFRVSQAKLYDNCHLLYKTNEGELVEVFRTNCERCHLSTASFHWNNYNCNYTCWDMLLMIGL